MPITRSVSTYADVMTFLRDLYRKTLVVLTAAPTYLAGAVMVLTIFREEVVSVLPDAWQADATGVIVSVVGALAAAIAVIRRVTPVLKGERGLLPPPTGEPVDHRPPVFD